MIENIKTDNIPLLDELVYNLKKIAITSVIKEEDRALKNETMESLKASDRYITCIEGNARFEMFEYSRELLKKSSVPEYLIDECVRDKDNIPKEKRAEVLKMAVDEFLGNYEETNNYYRMLNGLPDIGDPGIKLTPDYIDDQIEYLIDTRLYLHEMTDSNLDILYKFGTMDRLIAENPTKKYLERMGSRKIDIYKARKAYNFALLYTISDIPDVVMNRFKERYEINRVFTLKTVYNTAFKVGSDYYDNFIQIFILTQTLADMIAQVPDMIIKREIFDIRMIELMFKSHGVDFFPEIPFKYQLAMVRNINTLIKYKSTTANIVDICSLFGFDNVEVFKYYLLKDRQVDKHGNYLFETKEETDKDGNTTTVEDVEKNFDLKFIKVPIDDIADNYLSDKSKFLDYDEIVYGDRYWNGDLPHEYVKKSILEKEFNYIQSKYLSVDTIYSLTELSFQLIYFHNMLFDNKKVEELLKMNVPCIDSNRMFKFVDIVCYLNSLAYEYNNLEDDLMDTRSKIMYIKGFNFSVDMEYLANYVHEQGFTLEELGVSDFQIPEGQILTYKQLMYIFTKNKEIYDHIVKQLYTADNKKIYDIYKKIYDSMMIMELSMEFFRTPGGMAKTYTEFLKYRDVVLYKSLLEIKAIDSLEQKREKINNLINDTVYVIEQYIETDKFKYIFAYLPSVSAEAIKQYIYKVVNFFKSYKVDIMSINTIYKFDDKLENKIKMIDSVLFKYLYTKEDTIEVISKLQTTSKLTKKERIELLDQLYIEITFWVDLFFNTNMEIKDSVKDKIISLIKNDDLDIKDYKDLISKLDKVDFVECFCKKEIVASLSERERIELLDNIFFEVTFWLEKFFNEDMKFKEQVMKNISLLMKENKYELYASTYLDASMNYKDRVSIVDKMNIQEV